MLVNTSPCFSGEFKVTASDGHGWQQVRGCSGYLVTISGDSLSLSPADSNRNSQQPPPVSLSSPAQKRTPAPRPLPDASRSNEADGGGVQRFSEEAT
ncbi:hypothetical protein LXL04_029488 [Taraxacum kok-saghyz]